MKDGNNVSGRGRKSTPFYEEIDRILGYRAASQPAVLLSSVSGEDGDAIAMINTVPVEEESDNDNNDEGVCHLVYVLLYSLPFL